MTNNHPAKRWDQRLFTVLWIWVSFRTLLPWLVFFRLVAISMLVFLGLFVADAIYQMMMGEPMVFEGDTLGVKVDLTIIFFVLQFSLFSIALAWSVGSSDVVDGPGPKAMADHKKIIVKACVFFVPVQLALLIFGAPHELTDEIGVIGTLLQFVLLAYAFYPGSDYRRAHLETPADPFTQQAQ